MTNRDARRTRVLTRNRPTIKYFRTVGAAGADFKSLQRAIDYAGERATDDEPWGLEVYPGIPAENIVGRNNVHVTGQNPCAVILRGSVDLSGTNMCWLNMEILHEPEDDGDVTFVAGNGFISQCIIAGILTKDIEYTLAKGVTQSLQEVSTYNNCVLRLIDTGSQTKQIRLLDFDGLGSAVAFSTGMDFLCYQPTSGVHRGIVISGASEVALGNNRVYASHFNESFDGEWIFRSILGEANPILCVKNTYKASGNGGGTVYAFEANSGDSVFVEEDTAELNMDGYSDEYLDRTSVNDRQVIRLVSENKGFNSPVNDGPIAVTPKDMNMSGFRNYASTGNQYSLSGTEFTVLPGLVGYVKSVPIFIDPNKTTNIVANEENTLYFDTNGVLVRTDTKTNEIYQNNIPVFQVLYDGTYSIVKRENHPFDYPTAVSLWAHNVFGTRIGRNGANVERVATGNGGAIGDRQVKVVDPGTIDDHGINSIIPATDGAPITAQTWYKNASGNWIRYSSGTTLPMVYLLAGTVTAISANGYGILRIEAIIDDGNTTTPTYVVRLANEQYGNENDALVAISEERETEGAHITVADGAYLNLEPAKWFYAVVRNTVAGGYIVSLIRIRAAE